MIRLSTLPNGLRVITDTIDYVDTIAIGIWVQVGSRYELLELNGISHMLEHMAFKGTSTATAQEIAEKIESVGGRLNAYTARENTAYFARTLADDLPLAVEILADILQHSTFEDIELDREKQVILQEIAQVHDTPDDLIFDQFQDAAFQGQALGRPILGQVHNVENFTRTHLVEFMRDYYTAGQMLLVAAGKVNHDVLVNLAQEKFCHLSTKPAKEAPPAVYTGGCQLTERQLEQVHLVLGFKGCASSSDQFYPLSILGTILGGGMSSRLFQGIREKRGLVYSIYSFTASFMETGLMGIYAGMAPENTNEVIPLIHEELQNLESTLMPEDLSRAKQQLKASQLMSMESTTNRCEQLAHQMLVFGSPVSKEKIVENINKVTLEDVKDILQSVDNSPLTVAAIGDAKSLTSVESQTNSRLKFPHAA